LNWNNGLETIETMIEYYTREMGQLAGWLTTALSLLVDLENPAGWKQQGEQAKQMVHYSRPLVASVLQIVAAAQAARGDEMAMAKAIADSLKQFGEKNGGAGL
jgi:hypothetical protein